jgi:hypothetical protein
MRRFICIECNQECELIDIDDGNFEEVWGAKVWRPDYTSYSDCCHAEYEEVEDGDQDTKH